MRNCVVFRHVVFEDLGSLAAVLLAHNFTVRYFDVGIDNLAEIDVLTPDLLIVLGGPMSVYEIDKYPFLKDEIQLVKMRVQADLPCLGICLGAQLIATALGAQVYPGLAKEIGWYSIELIGIAKENYLKHLRADKTKIFHWHGDTFDLPHKATLLAASELCPHQAFSLGKTLALQFHPEMLADSLENWLHGNAAELCSSPSTSVTQLRADTAYYGSQLAQQAHKFWQGWLISLF